MKVSLAVAPMLFRRSPLIGLGYLNAYLKARGHEVSVFDTNITTGLPSPDDEAAWQDPGFCERYISKNPELLAGWAEQIMSGGPAVVGFSLWGSNKHVTFALAALVRQISPGCLVVFGGPHVSFETCRLLRDCPAADLLVIGEGEQTLLEAVELFEERGSAAGCPGTYYRRDSQIILGPPRPEIADLDSLPFPDYRDLHPERYHLNKALPLSFNRGCIRRCEFCNIHADWPAYRHRSAANIFSEMRQLLRDHANVDHFLIDSSAVNQDIGQLDALCELIIPSGLKFVWGGMAMVRVEMTPEFTRKLAAAGCHDLSYGLESGSQKVVNRMRKGFLMETAEQCVRNTHAAGIEVSLNLIIGAPDETDEDLRGTMDFLRRNKAYIDFVGYPSELALTTGIPMQVNLEKFGITPGPTANGTTWTAGANTHEVRQARIKAFTDFLITERIGEFSPQGRVRNLSGEQAPRAAAPDREE